MTNEIKYVTGDATRPCGEGPRIIAHVVNDVGGWGRGFVVALSRRWPEPEEMYRMWVQVPTNLSWCQGDGLPLRGNVQYVDIEPGLVVANMMAQHGIRHNTKAPPAIDYMALRTCLQKLGHEAAATCSSIHMPRIGCGLGGGRWDVVEKVILESLVDTFDLDVTVYSLPGEKWS